eukprot:15329012-Ditylum_brightwellii.AAC.1
MAAFISGAAGVSPSVSDDISSAETIKGGHLTLPSVDTMFNEGAVGSRKEVWRVWYKTGALEAEGQGKKGKCQ